MLVSLAPQIALTALLSIGIVGGVLFAGVKALLTRIGTARSRNVHHMIRWVSITMRGQKDIRAYGKEQFFLRRFDGFFDRVLHADRLMRVIEQSPRIVNETLLILSLVVTLLLMSALGIPLTQQIPVLSAFGVAGARLVVSASRLMTSLQSINYYDAAFQTVNEQYEESGPSAPATTPEVDSPPLTFARRITFENVSFRYPAGPLVLDDLSLSIPKGSAIALAGPSGAGKSTALDILMGLVVPSKGSVLADGRDIHRNTAAWRAHIGYIPQHVYLLDDTIRSNVAFGVPEQEIDDDRVWRALRQAQMETFVGGLAGKLDHVIGENGLTLSGGQRQRLGIARALYVDADILLLDEATAALDNRTEQAIGEVLAQMKGDKTLIYVAHRLTTIQHCDRIYYMENGRIVASGTYNELLAASESFRRMALTPVEETSVSA
jgi:ATP-binding cassette subfamily C protein